MPYDALPESGRHPLLVRPVRVDPSGDHGPTKRQAQGRHWRRSSRGLYLPATVDATVPEQRILEAAAVLPEVGGVTGWAGLRWAGAAWFDGLTPGGKSLLDVDLATCYQDIRSQPGFHVWQERLGPVEVERLDDVQMTTPVRSLFFAMRYAPSVREAVKCMDMAAFSDICSISEARDYFLAHPGWTGVPQARDALDLADENSWSPAETGLRIVWVVDAGLPHPLCNRPVFDRRGNLIGAPDLLDPESGACGEYDGTLHLKTAQRARDNQRAARFRDHGLEPFNIMSTDMTNRSVVAEQMHAARRRAKWEAESRRTWTTTPPPWWLETHTVALRRALDAEQRARILRHRNRVS